MGHRKLVAGPECSASLDQTTAFRPTDDLRVRHGSVGCRYGPLWLNTRAGLGLVRRRRLFWRPALQLPRLVSCYLSVLSGLFVVALRARDEAALSLPPACLLGIANIALPRCRSLPRPAALRSGHPPHRRRRPGMVGGGPARDRGNRHALHHAADLHSGALSACSP